MFLLRNTAYNLKTRIVGKSIEDTLEEITSETDENLNVPTRIYQEIAEKSFNQNDYDVIIKYIWRQFTANARPWRKILKTLNLIEYLIKNGSPRFVDDTKEEIYHIRLLSRFSQQENGEDKGTLIREKSVKLDELLNDQTLLDNERRKADTERRKLKNLGVFGPSGATNASIPAKTYQGFSSEDMNSIVTPNGGVVHKKTESDDGIDVSGDEKDREIKDLEEDGIVKSDMINNIDLTKDQKPEITDLLDFGDVQATSTASIENTPVNVLRDVSNAQQNKPDSPIWSWDQKPYNKYTKTEETNEFDWTKAPSTENLDKPVLDNLYQRSHSTPVQNGVNTVSSDLVTHTSDTMKPSKNAYNQKEKNMIDLTDMKDFQGKQTNENCPISNKNDIDELFSNMSIYSNNSMQQQQMNKMQMNYGQQYYTGATNF